MARDAQRHDGGTGWLYVAMGVVAVAFLATMSAVTAALGPVAIPIWGLGVIGAIFIANGPIGKAIGRKIAGGDVEAPVQVEVPEEVYAELDELRARMLEMEERQDFAERLLAQRSEVNRLDEGGTA